MCIVANLYLKKDGFCNVDKQTLFNRFQTGSNSGKPISLMLPNKIHDIMN